jgi:hypothetical protein
LPQHPILLSAMGQSIQESGLDFTELLYKKMTKKLKDIALEESNLLHRYQKCIQVILPVIEELKQFIIGYTFQSIEEEITFFKYVKPKFFSQLIFYVRIFNIKSHCLGIDKAAQEKYIHKELQRLRYYLLQNQFFLCYYLTGATYLDNKYFVRGSYDLHLFTDDFIFNTDAQFSTSHDYYVARIVATKRLQKKLKFILSRLENPPLTSHQPPLPWKTRFTWTHSKTALIELMYALQSAGVFNNSTADIKQIASCFEWIFNVDLKNYYRTFLEIRSRKANRTAFLDLLKERLIKRMDEADEHMR